jgi:hypothetical protein
MKTIKQINHEISLLNTQLEYLKGRPCEVYTRIVGYYRSVKWWNKGKQEEYKKRLPFKIKGEK